MLLFSATAVASSVIATIIFNVSIAFFLRVA
jgi:hypothetical protein